MNKTHTPAAVILKTALRGGSVPSGKDPPPGYNHTQRGLAKASSGLTLKSGLRGGGSYGGVKDPPSGFNHNQRGLVNAPRGITLKTGVRGGIIPTGKEPPPGYNHNQRGLAKTQDA
ncbi:MAG: hypothetical protein HY823_01920 [Acidobacteria bacterium]|nr:hypothetical protein [Acidobacteriota bacterium]